MTAWPAAGAARLTIIAGVLFIATGLMHSVGLTWATGLAAQGPRDLAAVIPTLWLGTTAAMVTPGIMLMVIGRTPGPPNRVLVGLAALVPLANAGLLVAGAGASPPVYIFGVVGLVTLVAVWRHPTA